MHSQEEKVSPRSDYYVYVPSTLARKLYLYPLHVGYFIYEPGYYIKRDRFDSFLIMYIVHGTVDIVAGDSMCRAREGEFVLLDCYRPHQYGSRDEWEASWLHFDGTLAREYYREITSQYGIVLSPENPKALSHIMNKICNLFRTSSPIIEHEISGHITDLLNSLLAPMARKSSSQPSAIVDSIAYINEHFQEQISLNHLAEMANLSLYHFTRSFAKETGFTPHQYLINARVAAAKFMLKSSEIPVKDIGYSAGFHSESSFCTTFKKWVGVTPTQYRGDSSKQT